MLSRLAATSLALIICATTACTSSPPPSPSANAPAANRSGAAQDTPRNTVPEPSPPNQPAPPYQSLLPLSGEFVVTANREDRSLTVVPIGAASVATTVRLSFTPAGVVTIPGSDQALVSDEDPASQTLALAGVNASRELSSVVLGTRASSITSPSGAANGPVAILNDSGGLQLLNPMSYETSAPLALTPGPHAVSVASPQFRPAQKVFVANTADGTISIVGPESGAIESTLAVGGRPGGIVATADGRLWVMDAASGTIKSFDPSIAQPRAILELGAALREITATRDGRYVLVAASSPANRLYVIDAGARDGSSAQTQVRELEAPADILAVATGASPVMAFVTTADDKLLYWNLTTNSIVRSVGVGRAPIDLAVGLVPTTGSGSTGGEPGGGGSGASGASSSTTSSSGSAGAGATTASGSQTSTGGASSGSAAGSSGSGSSSSGAQSSSSSTSSGGASSSGSTGGSSGGAGSGGSSGSAPAPSGSTGGSVGAGSGANSSPLGSSSSASSSLSSSSANSGSGGQAGGGGAGIGGAAADSSSSSSTARSTTAPGSGSGGNAGGSTSATGGATRPAAKPTTAPRNATLAAVCELLVKFLGSTERVPWCADPEDSDEPPDSGRGSPPPAPTPAPPALQPAPRPTIDPKKNQSDADVACEVLRGFLDDRQLPPWCEAENDYQRGSSNRNATPTPTRR